MKIGILSKRPESYSILRLAEACREREHDAVLVDYDRCWMNIAAHRPTVWLEGEPMEEIDVVIPRIATTSTFYGAAVVRQFEMMGVPTVNSAIAITRARDKLRSLQILSSKGLGLPVTAFSNATHDIDGLIDAVGGAPLVVKVIEGTQGMGVVLAETRKSAEALIQAFRGLNAQFLVQEYIKESAGMDMRCFVVDGKVIASMIRRAPAGEFRANIHRGGIGEKVRLTPEERQTAVRAAKAMNLKVAGVDILRSNHGPVVLEVNASPGLEGIETASGVDVAGAIVDFAARMAPRGRKEDRIEQ